MTLYFIYIRRCFLIWYESLVRIVADKGKKVTGNKPEHLGKRFVHTAVHKVASPYAQHCTARCTTLHPRVHKVVSAFLCMPLNGTCIILSQVSGRFLRA